MRVYVHTQTHAHMDARVTRSDIAIKSKVN